MVLPEREGWVPGHLPRWPQEMKPRDRCSKDAWVETSLLDTMLLFFTSFLKFLLILPLSLNVSFSLYFIVTSSTFSQFFSIKYLNFCLSSFKVTPL